MNNYTKKSIEILSLCLVLSFLIKKSIIILLLGMILSIYSLKINNILKDDFNHKDVNNKLNKTSSKKKNLNLEIVREEYKTSLAEQVDELGFIPSLENNEKDIA